MHSQPDLDQYARYLIDLASLSRLFSENTKPYIHSRTAEYLYCRVYEAENLSRSDIAIDAKKDTVGTGVKTFVYSSRPTFQKIAEFNKAIGTHGPLQGIEKISLVSSLRNERLRFVEDTYGINSLQYHCVLRDNSKILVYEEPMHKIKIDTLRITSSSPSTLKFTDGIDNYSFSLSKSTILKEFRPTNPFIEIDTRIIEDPFEILARLEQFRSDSQTYIPEERVVLPLYGTSGHQKTVYPRSGLNQWNAAGRQRSYDEVYLPIPAEVRSKYPDFFPERDAPFEIEIPNGNRLTVKVCQDNGKALMSNPNSALGDWLLREVLGLQEGELLTYQKLAELDVGAVEISKSGSSYNMEFLPIGSYEKFIKLDD